MSNEKMIGIEFSMPPKELLGQIEQKFPNFYKFIIYASKNQDEHAMKLLGNITQEEFENYLEWSEQEIKIITQYSH